MDSPELENLHNIIAHEGNVEIVRINKDNGTTYASFGEDFIVNLWQIGSNKPKNSIGPFKSKITAIEFSHKDGWLLTGNNDGIVQIFDLRDSRCVYQWVAHKSTVTAICAHPSNHSIILTGGVDGKLLLLSTQMRRPLQIFAAHKGRINAIAISKDGKFAATAGDDKTVKIFDLTSTRQIAKFESFTDAVTCVTFHDFRPLICCGGKDRNVKFFDIAKQAEIPSEIPLDSAPISVLSFQSEEGLVFTGSNDYLKVVGFEPSKLYDTLPLGFDCLNDISINDVKVTIASTSGDRILIDRIRKDVFKPYVFNPVSVVAIGQGAIEMPLERTEKPRTPRLLDMDEVRPLSNASLKRTMNSGKLGTINSAREQRKRSEETGIFHFKTTSIKKKAKRERPEFEEYQKTRQDSMLFLTSRYAKLCSINDLLTSFGLEETLKRICEREDLASEILNILRLKPDALTKEVSPYVIRIAGFAFIENPEVAVSTVEVVLQMFGADFLEDQKEGKAEEITKELAKLIPMLKKAKNGYETYSESAKQILEMYGPLFSDRIL